MPTIDQQREELKKAYPHSEGWARKVNKMPETQVAAIYIRFSAEGRLGK